MRFSSLLDCYVKGETCIGKAKGMLKITIKTFIIN